MLAFEPRTSDQIRMEMMAQLVAQSDDEITDVEESGAAHGILGVIGVQAALVEQRIRKLYRAFGFNGSGSDLDDRVRLLPGFDGRKGPSAASGAVMRFTRLDASTEITVPAGIRIVSKTDSSVEVITTQAFTMSVGQYTYPAAGQTPVRVVATKMGPQANVVSGVLEAIASTTSTAIVSCTNIRKLTGGLNRESDTSLRRRALGYIASLCQTSRAAVEWLALSFQAEDGTRALHAAFVEDANTPAFAKLVVDDGSGFQGSTRPGARVTGTTPANGQLDMWCESPAATTPKVTIGGVVYPPAVKEWVTLHERGSLQLHPDSTLLASGGIEWAVHDYEVYYGFIAELQWVIEALLSLPSRAPGWRVPGGRVQVVAPKLQLLVLDGVVSVGEGYEFDDVMARATDAVVAFHQALAPGKRLVLSQLTAAVLEVEGVIDIHWSSPLDNVDPATRDSKLYPAVDGINLAA